jgi:hypothetical protein
MRASRGIIHFLGGVALCVVLAHSTHAQDQKAVEQIKKGDPRAILEAGKTGDKSLIPLLEGMARPPDAELDPEAVKGMDPQHAEKVKEAMRRPTYDEPSAVSARMALAKIGVKDYLDEMVSELTTTNSHAYNAQLHYYSGSPDHARLMTQSHALKALLYVNNPSTVKYIASVLYDTYDPNRGNTSDAIQPVPAVEAAETLRQMLGTGPSDTTDIAAWKNWWEQNKDKYP